MTLSSRLARAMATTAANPGTYRASLLDEADSIAGMDNVGALAALKVTAGPPTYGQMVTRSKALGRR